MTNNIGMSLLDAINSADAVAAVLQIQQYKENMRNPQIGADYVMWITEPPNLTSVHKALTTSLNIPQRLLAIKRSALNRTQKSVLLVQAIENAIKRVHTI